MRSSSPILDVAAAVALLLAGCSSVAPLPAPSAPALNRTLTAQ